MNEPILIDLPEQPVPQVLAEETERKRELLIRVGTTDDYILTIDNSSLEKSLTCSRRAEYALVHRRETSENKIALRFGGAIHKALETRYIYGHGEAVRQMERDTLVKQFQHIPVPIGDHRTLECAIQVMDRYQKDFPVDLFKVVEDDQGQPMVELPFAENLGTLNVQANIRLPEREVYVKRIFVVWTGRIDMIVEWDGKFWILDHKTSSILGEQFFHSFELDQATVGYAWAAQRILGKPIAGLVLDTLGIRKPSKTGKQFEFSRKRFPYTQEMYDEWEPNTLALVGEFINYLRVGFFPKKTKWCFEKYGMCPYHPVCTLPIKDRMTHLMGPDYKDVTWSPLDNPDVQPGTEQETK